MKVTRSQRVGKRPDGCAPGTPDLGHCNTAGLSKHLALDADGSSEECTVRRNLRSVDGASRTHDHASTKLQRLRHNAGSTNMHEAVVTTAQLKSMRMPSMFVRLKTEPWPRRLCLFGCGPFVAATQSTPCRDHPTVLSLSHARLFHKRDLVKAVDTLLNGMSTTVFCVMWPLVQRAFQDCDGFLELNTWSSHEWRLDLTTP